MALLSYFGGKSPLVPLYPRPTYPLIIEPFCGGAAYATHYRHSHRVWINDIDPDLCAALSWLIQATREDVRRLPSLKPGDKISALPDVLSNGLAITRELRNLLGYSTSRGSSIIRDSVTSWGAAKNNSQFARWHDVAETIRNWQLTNLDYRQLPNIEATWFVDPPYQSTGLHWSHGKCLGDGYRYGANRLNYKELAEWCRTRRGQVIVCEAEGACWLPFRRLTGPRRRRCRTDTYREVVWIRS